MSTPPNKSPLVVVGGVELEVEFLDGSRSDRQKNERVRVRQLAVKSMDRYLEVFGNESATIELFCEKPAGWADMLTPESFDAVIEKVDELNLPLFQNWHRRLIKRTEIMSPGLAQRAQEAASAAIAQAAEVQARASASTSSAQSSASDAG